MADRRRAAAEYLKAAGADLRPDFHDGAGRDRRHWRRDGPNFLRRSRYRQGPARGSIQDYATGGRRLLSGLARGQSGFAKAVGLSAMAAYLGAEQELRDLPGPRRRCSLPCRVFWLVARHGQGRLPREERASVAACAERFAPAGGPRGEISDAATGQFATTTAAQIAPRRHPAVDQRQLPRAVRFLSVRLLCTLHRQGILSIP